jgi:hypothetical protein
VHDQHVTCCWDSRCTWQQWHLRVITVMQWCRLGNVKVLPQATISTVTL